MEASYPGDGDSDRAADPAADPAAVPGLRPNDDAAEAASVTIDVDGQMFALRPNESGGTDYTWLSGPDPGYGFGVSPTPDLSLGEHLKNIRDFLAMVDPATGHIEDE